MATLPTATKNSRCDLIVDSIDLGSTNTYGQLWLMDASDNVLSKHNFSDPAFGDASGGSALSDTIESANAILSGTATKFKVVDKDETEIFAGTITAVGGGGDIESKTSSTALTAGENVDIDPITYVEGG